jgi:hypothetical protein
VSYYGDKRVHWRKYKLCLDVCVNWNYGPVAKIQRKSGRTHIRAPWVETTHAIWVATQVNNGKTYGTIGRAANFRCPPKEEKDFCGNLTPLKRQSECVSSVTWKEFTIQPLQKDYRAYLLPHHSGRYAQWINSCRILLLCTGYMSGNLIFRREETTGNRHAQTKKDRIWQENWIGNIEDVNWPPLWSSGQSSCLQIQRSGFDSRRYQIFWEVLGLERGPLSLVSAIEELLERKSSGSCLETREYDSWDPSRWPRVTLYQQKLALTSPTSGGPRSVGIIRLRTQATEFIGG